jgi:hypothetical protein
MALASYRQQAAPYQGRLKHNVAKPPELEDADPIGFPQRA